MMARPAHIEAMTPEDRDDWLLDRMETAFPRDLLHAADALLSRARGPMATANCLNTRKKRAPCARLSTGWQDQLGP